MSATEDQAGSRVIRYSICLTALLLTGALIASARHALWAAAALFALVAMAAGPALSRSPRRRAWWAATGLLALDAVATVVIIGLDGGRSPSFGALAPVLNVLAYLTTAVAVMLVIFGRVRRATWLGEVDFLVLFTTLTALTWTLVVLLLVHRSADSWLLMLGTYLAVDVLVLAVLAREVLRAEPAPPARVWLLATGAQLAMIGMVGALTLHQDSGVLPPGWMPAMRALWLVGVAILGGYAVLPPRREQAAQEAQEAREAAAGPAREPVPAPTPAAYLGALHRPTPATVALLAVALLGPPLEIARPDLADLVTLCLMAMVFLLLRDARRRAHAEETIRSTAVELAGAQDTAVILAATLAGTGACLPGHRAEVVVCANGPQGPLATASTRRDREAAALATDMTSPAARVDRVLAGRPHLTVVSPGQSPQAAQIALGAVGEGPELTGQLGVLELLAAQASHALDRVRLSAERNRRAGEAQFRTLVRNAADVIMIVSARGAVRFASPSARGLLGIPDATGAFVEDVFGPVNARVVRLRLARTYAATEDPVPEYWTLERDEGRPLELEVRFADLRTDPTVGGLVLTIRDVTEQHRLQRELEYLAFHDALTGLGNGLRFGAQVEAELAQDTRIASCRTVVMVAEIDDFWNLINLRGRAAADRVLVGLARRLEAMADGAARLSGATFAALAVPADHGCRDAASLARRLQQELSRPLDLGTESVSAQVSVGAVGVAGLADADEAQRRAGLALTEAKTDRCRPWRVYQPSMLDAAVDRAALHGDLAAALAGEAADLGAVRDGLDPGPGLPGEGLPGPGLPGEGLAVHYQPIVDLASGTVSGFEALARWRHPERGSIPPSRFVALAEETGLIVPLGRWALRRAVADLACLRALTRGSSGLRMAVNVSPLQLSEPDFPSEVAAVIEESGVPAEALCLEITESSVLDQSGRTLDVLRELKAMGLSLAIDDFGTGHSALSYLPDLPFDSLKIDRSFITTIATSPSRAEIVRGIVRIAGAVGMRVVAEGIEAGRQQDLLVEASCDYGQGYLYSMPVPVEEAKALLDRNWPTATATQLGRLAGQLAAEPARRPIAGVA